VLLAFDFDGVLAPIVATPPQAHMRAGTRRLLAQVAERYPCIVLSGRRRDDLAPRVEGIPFVQVIGNFGHELTSHNKRPPSRVHEWLAVLQERLGHESGVRLEDKGYSLAVHYRHAPEQSRARRAVAAAVKGLEGARLLDGTLALTVLPAEGPNKGVALQAARQKARCDRAFYIGDDGTDEDAFVSAPPEQLLSVRVGTGTTQAGYRLKTQAEIDDLLRCFLAFRPVPAPGP
jgi:trehalose 6-phosphate phosphatase